MPETSEVLAQYGRQLYVPSGRVHWRFFAINLVQASLLAVLVGGLLYLALLGGLYFMLMTPIVMSLLTGGIVYQLVQWSHCRNIALAATTGTVLGIVTFLAHYQAQVVHHLGIQGLWRIDLLPGVAWYRLETDSQLANPGNRPEMHVSSGVIANGIFALLDLVICGGIAGSLGYQSAQKVYDEANRRWTKQKTLFFASGNGVPLVSGLFTGQLSTAISAAQPVTPVISNDNHPVTTSHCLVVIDYSLDKQEKVPAAAFLSITEVPGNQLLRRCELSLEERTAIAPYVTG